MYYQKKTKTKRYRITGLSLNAKEGYHSSHIFVNMMHSVFVWAQSSAFLEIITCMHDFRYQKSERNLWPHVCLFFQLIPNTQSSIFTNHSHLSIICAVVSYLLFSFHYMSVAPILNIWFIVINKYWFFGPNTQFNDFDVVIIAVFAAIFSVLVFIFIIFENEILISLLQ